MGMPVSGSMRLSLSVVLPPPPVFVPSSLPRTVSFVLYHRRLYCISVGIGVGIGAGIVVVVFVSVFVVLLYCIVSYRRIVLYRRIVFNKTIRRIVVYCNVSYCILL